VDPDRLPFVLSLSKDGNREIEFVGFYVYILRCTGVSSARNLAHNLTESISSSPKP